MIRPGLVVILDGGTTALQVARNLSPTLRATIVTTLLCIVPPSIGSGWQMTAITGCAMTSASGGSTATSSAPAGPARISAAAAVGKEGDDMLE